jgi:hypothetical protein
MRVDLRPAPWAQLSATPELDEAIEILADGTWAEAARDFFTERSAKTALGKRAQKGVQPSLNRVLTRRFEAAGWDAYDGRFMKEATWVRVTFRHQMSLGSDIIDAIRAHHRAGMELVTIMAASRAFLNLISPNDAAALTSYEKLKAEVDSLQGCLDIPLLVGRLEAQSPLPPEVSRAVTGARKRDVTLPSD